jgi:hypothetical protein
LAVLAATAGSIVDPFDAVPTQSVKIDVENSGFTSVAFALGLHRLLAKKFLLSTEIQDINGPDFPGLKISNTGWDWIDRNESKFVITRRTTQAKPAESTSDDVPF